MNLRDKLSAISKKPSKPASPPAAEMEITVWHACHVHGLEEFPGYQEIGREVLSLMENEPMPEGLSPERILYLDTETTGFQGAGTVAFMIGVGYLTENGFEVHQYVMRDYPEEVPQLKALEETLKRFDVICTFNGRSFDVPLLRTRFRMNRMQPDCLDKPHIDLLHIARRVYKLRLKQCSLGHLEEAVLGRGRLKDLPGSEAPERFFRYLETGEFHLLDEVREHNEQDIASLCTLLSHMCAMYREPGQLSFMEDVYAMGVSLERMHHVEEARRCYRLVSAGRMHAQSQLRLAQSYRRAEQRRDACEVWRKMLESREGGAVPYVELAKHYEHKERNLPAALDMTRRALALLSEPTLLETDEERALRESLHARYRRLQEKMKRKANE